MNANHLFVLGKGAGEPIAREGALKIKEITYLHAEGYPGGALKHGPFALITEGTPVILLILNDRHSGLMKTAAEEVKARGARNIIITDEPSLARGIADPNDVIVIPPDGVLTGLLTTVPLQFLAYELAVLKGINPDKPRNLAKAVTVD
jgi:glucosamine--fructose-6-phosphate aminotransferase (isomerizing)